MCTVGLLSWWNECENDGLIRSQISFTNSDMRCVGGWVMLETFFLRNWNFFRMNKEKGQMDDQF